MMKVTIIGCGTMGGGFARRLSSEHQVFLYDAVHEKAEVLQKEGCGIVCQNIQEALIQSDVLLLAVKPQSLDSVLGSIIHCAKADIPQIVISILSGTTIAQLQAFFPKKRIIRMMPNLPLICGEALIGVSIDAPLTKEEFSTLSTFCQNIGKIQWVDETKMDAFTALAGSGPAFVFVMIESMVDAGISMGFSATEAQKMVVQMMKGSLKVLEHAHQHPGELKWKVSSPEGTTIAGIKKMEELGMRHSIIQTFLATYERAKELS